MRRDASSEDGSGSEDEALARILREVARTPDLRAAEPVSPGRPREGELLGDRYQVIAIIGHGGFGHVYLATDRVLGREVAVKLLRRRLLRSAGELQLFQREARATARLSHPGIVTAHDSGEWRGVPFLVLERLEGESLATVLARGPLDERRALDIAIQVAEALVHAHEHGVLHLDLKPANVFVTRGGRVKVLDFGLAGLDQPISDESGETLPARVPGGTPGMMAPEQARGSATDARTDVWALGLLVRSMLGARKGRLRAIAERALADEPARRFPDAASILAALIALNRRSRRRIAVVAAVAVLAGTIAATAVISRRLEPDSIGTPGSRSGRRPVVAILPLGAPDGAAWLGVSAADALRAQLAVDERLVSVEADTVARAALGRSSDEIRRGLDADWIVSGGVAADGPTGVAVSLRVEDVRRGVVVSVEESGRAIDLVPVALRAGDGVRAAIGLPPLPATQLDLARAGQPTDPDAARLHAEGLARLRQLDPMGARPLLEEAIRIEPRAPLIHAALARTLAELGYASLASAAAKRAFDLAGGLPRAERLRIEAQYRETTYEWDKAVAVHRALYDLFPDELDIGLRLSAALATAGRPDEALELLATLPSHDGRVDLAEAAAAEAKGDPVRTRAAAERAVQKARAHGAKLILGDALLAAAAAAHRVGDLDAAAARVAEAREVYEALGLRRGLALVARVEGRLAVRRGDHHAALGRFDEALQIARAIDDRSRMAELLFLAANVHDITGDLARARLGYEEALSVALEVGDRRATLNPLLYLGDLLHSAGDPDAAEERLRQALDAARAIGDRLLARAALGRLGSLLLLRGDVAAAAEMAGEGLALARAIGMSLGLAHQLANAGDVAFYAGRMDDARALHEEARRVYEQSGSTVGAASERAKLARIAVEEGRAGEAIAVAGAASAELALRSDAENMAYARTVWAEALLESGAAEAAWQVARSVGALRGVSLSRGLEARVVTAAAGARLPRERAAAVKALDGIAVEAARAGLAYPHLTARLLAARLARRRSDRARVLGEARERGLLLVVQRDERNAFVAAPSR